MEIGVLGESKSVDIGGGLGVGDLGVFGERGGGFGVEFCTGVVGFEFSLFRGGGVGLGMESFRTSVVGFEFSLFRGGGVGLEVESFRTGVSCGDSYKLGASLRGDLISRISIAELGGRCKDSS